MSVLDELFARAGASDKDRLRWLAERAGGVTATEIRDLYMRYITVSALIKKKLGPPEPPLTTQWIMWGNTREPILADVVNRVYGIHDESRVFHSATNPRHLASPDGVGVVDGELVVSEIKTSKDDIRLGTKAFDKKGYAIQMTWVMFVTGAHRCLYVAEQHDSDWQDRGGPNLEPEPLGLVPTMEWFEYDEKLAKELEVIATGFLVALDAAKAGEVLQYDDDLDTLAVNILRFREEETSAKKAKESTWAQLQVKLRGEHDELSQESPLARITWRAASSKTVVENVDVVQQDIDKAKAANPMAWAHLELCRAELVDAGLAVADAEEAWQKHLAGFSKTVVEPQSRVETTKESLTVTSVKPKKETKK
jgi:hypothetical protein